MVFHGPPDRPAVALTLDDGPDPATTPTLLDTLERLDVRATFFLIGERAAAAPRLVADIAARGHEIGHHMWKDRASARLEPAELGLGPSAVADPRDLDRPLTLSAEGRAQLGERLERVADPRVEEAERPPSRLSFYWRAVRADPRAVPSMVRWARPWLFPLRLGRMSAAALSVLLVLMMTAEAWELGVTRGPAQAIGLSVFALLGTTGLVITRQGLLVRSRTHLTEQSALSNLATVVAVGLGLLSTFVFLLVAAFVAATVVFDGPVTAGWAGAETLTLGQRLVFATFGAALGMVAGALGASFEEAEDFQHIARIDREL
ncbi:MAG: polysaccharide deacetylase family protein [Alphaproteobacteria bacterium]